MKKIIILSFLILSGCGSEPSKESLPNANQLKVSGSTCEDLTLKMLAQSGHSESEVIKTLIYNVSENQVIDDDTVSHCLDQNLIINCNNNECKITQKDATK